MSSPNDFALCAAARTRDLDKTLALLAAGTAPDAPSAQDVPLIEAAQRGSLEIVRALLEAGADPNRLPPPKKSLYPSPFDGMSALDHALVARNEEMALALVQAGANPTRPMRSLYERLLPRDAAEAAKMSRLLGALEARDAPRTPDEALALTPAAVAGRTARVAALLALGTDEQARGSALLMAAQVGQASSMRLLVAEAELRARRARHEPRPARLPDRRRRQRGRFPLPVERRPVPARLPRAEAVGASARQQRIRRRAPRAHALAGRCAA